MTPPSIPSTNSRETAPIRWGAVVESLRRPYRVSLPMCVLASLIPLYLFIPELALGQPSRPELFLDRWIPVRPSWSLVYGAGYLVLILLPIFVVRHQETLRRTVYAYLSVWLTSYLVFVLYPTEAPRPAEVFGDGFAAWGLRSLYHADPPFNCFPSLHVAHSFVSAFASHRVHRGVGTVAVGLALLVSLSTLFTKQHYVLDVVAGIILASSACGFFLGGVSRERIPWPERQLAPAFLLLILVSVAVFLGGFWVAYRASGVL